MSSEENYSSAWETSEFKRQEKERDVAAHAAHWKIAEFRRKKQEKGTEAHGAAREKAMFVPETRILPSGLKSCLATAGHTNRGTTGFPIQTQHIKIHQRSLKNGLIRPR
jgi:hypothetical protein